MRRGSKAMMIRVVGYPDTFTFKTDVKLPPFKSGCKVREKILHENMELLQVRSPSHAYEDYIVEVIEKRGFFEFWHLGS
jgi:hypothetical protein